MNLFSSEKRCFDHYWMSVESVHHVTLGLYIILLSRWLYIRKQVLGCQLIRIDPKWTLTAVTYITTFRFRTSKLSSDKKQVHTFVEINFTALCIKSIDLPQILINTCAYPLVCVVIKRTENIWKYKIIWHIIEDQWDNSGKTFSNRTLFACLCLTIVDTVIYGKFDKKFVYIEATFLASCHLNPYQSSLNSRSSYPLSKYFKAYFFPANDITSLSK